MTKHRPCHPRIYHHTREAHIGRYYAEFDLRYNTRELSDGEGVAAVLKGGEGRRLTYRRIDKLTASAGKNPAPDRTRGKRYFPN